MHKLLGTGSGTNDHQCHEDDQCYEPHHMTWEICFRLEAYPVLSQSLNMHTKTSMSRFTRSDTNQRGIDERSLSASGPRVDFWSAAEQLSSHSPELCFRCK